MAISFSVLPQPIPPSSKGRRGWIVGVNASGYLPDSEPVTYGVFNDAFMGLMEEMTRTRESLFDDDAREADDLLDNAIEKACQWVKDNPNGAAYSVQLMGLVHWIEPA